MILNKKFFLGDDCFEQICAPTNNETTLFIWTQPAKCAFLPIPFAHSFDIIFWAQNSSATFIIDSQIFNVKKGQTVTIPAGCKYVFRGLEHQSNIMLCCASEKAAQDWAAVAGQIPD